MSAQLRPDSARQTVALLEEIPHDRGLLVERDGEKILLVRQAGGVRAYGAECPHAGAPLNEGAVCNGRIVCPWHKAAFSVTDGGVVEPPALRGLARYDVTVQGNGVFLGARLPGPDAPRRAGAGTALILGAGAAGAAAAAALREFGFGGRVILAGNEPGAPYDRTALSKFVMAGDMAPGDVPPLLDDEFLEKHGVERVIGDITEFDVAGRRAWFADGQALSFDTALIATGAMPVHAKLPGADLAGVHVLRSRADAAAVLDGLHAGMRAVILGSSFIGLEAACGLRGQQLHVAVVSPENVPFARQFGEELGAVLKDLHAANGVQFFSGLRAASLQGAGRVSAVVLEDGTTLPADIVLVAMGVKPATGFMRGVALQNDGGVAVDAGMRVAAGVYAAGDIACFALPHGAGAARIEHWRVAQQQARIAACNMAGGRASYEGVPFFWTYHYGKRWEYLGHAPDWENVVIDGDPRQHNFIALLCAQGTVRAAVACGRERATAMLIEAMRAPLTPVDAVKICAAAV